MKRIAAVCIAFVVPAFMICHTPSASAAPPANSIVLVNDTIADGDRTNQALPASIALIKG